MSSSGGRGGTTRTLAIGPAVTSFPLSNSAALNAGGVDYLAFTVSLLTSADNTFQGKTAALSINFVGAQQTGTNR